MNAAQRIIAAFDGPAEMARKMSEAVGRRVPPSTVQYWGECGHVPAKRQPEVLATARRFGVPISATDFFESQAA